MSTEDVQESRPQAVGTPDPAAPGRAGETARAIRQLNVDCYDCAGPLNDADSLIHALRDAADAVGATVLDTHACAYQPHGITAVAFLLESHVMITTWPEHDYAVVEAFLCNPRMDPMAAWRRIEACLRPRRHRLSWTPHRVPM